MSTSPGQPKGPGMSSSSSCLCLGLARADANSRSWYICFSPAIFALPNKTYFSPRVPDPPPLLSPISVTTTLRTTLIYTSTRGRHTRNAAAGFKTYPKLCRKCEVKEKGGGLGKCSAAPLWGESEKLWRQTYIHLGWRLILSCTFSTNYGQTRVVQPAWVLSVLVISVPWILRLSF